MGLIKIVQKTGVGSYLNWYVGQDIKSIVGTTTGSADNTQISTIVIKTVSGVTATIALTTGVQEADLASIVADTLWGKAILADSQGPEFAGLIEGAQIGTSGKAGVVGGASLGVYFLLLADGSVSSSSTAVTIDSVAIS